MWRDNNWEYCKIDKNYHPQLQEAQFLYLPKGGLIQRKPYLYTS